jgi:hypothetical protein
MVGFTSPVEAAPPLVTCSVEQTHVTQRWWVFGNRVIMDFGLSGSGNPTLLQNSTNVNSPEGTTVVTDTAGELMFYSDG